MALAALDGAPIPTRHLRIMVRATSPWSAARAVCGVAVGALGRLVRRPLSLTGPRGPRPDRPNRRPSRGAGTWLPWVVLAGLLLGGLGGLPQTALGQAPALEVSKTTLEVGATGSLPFTVKLATAPSATVTVAVTSDDTDVTVSPPSLTFGTTDYSTARTVTVNMAADPSDNLDATITLAASGGGYDTLTASVSVSEAHVPVPVINSITSGDAALVVDFSWDKPAKECSTSALVFEYRKSAPPDQRWGVPADPNNADSGTFEVRDLSKRSFTIGRGARGRNPGETGAFLANDVEYDVRLIANHYLPGIGCHEYSAWSNTGKGTPKLVKPDVPTNLTAVPGEDRVALGWRVPTNTSKVEKMQVRWKATADLPFDDTTDTWTDLDNPGLGDRTDTAAVSYDATGLTADTAYTFAVRAVNDEGHGEATIQATPSLTPGPPENLTATAGDQAVTLSWSAPTTTLAPDGFQVRWKATADLSFDDTTDTWTDLDDATATTWTATGLTNKTNYTFEVRAFNTGPGQTKVQGTAAEANATPVVTIEPPVISSVTAGDQALTINWVWDKPSRTHCDVAGRKPFFAIQYSKSAPGYDYRDTNQVTDDAKNDSTNGHYFIYDDMDATSFTIDAQATLPGVGQSGVNLENGEQYKVRMWVGSYTSASGCIGTPFSNEANGTPVPPIPDAPTSLSATAGDTKVTLSWVVPTNASQIEKVQVRWKETSSLPFDATDTWTDVNNSAPYAPGTADTSIEVTSLTNATGYTFEVRASNSAGDGEAATTTATPVAPPNNPPVVDKAIPDAELNEGKSGTVDLSAVFSDPDKDPLTFSAVSSDTTQVTVAVDGSELTYTSVSAGKPTVTVTADDGRGGTVSTTFTVTVHGLPNDPPIVAKEIEDLTLSAGETRDVDVSLVFNDPDKDPLTYTASSGDTTKATVSVNGATVTVTAVAAGTSTVTVTAGDNKAGTVDDEFTVTVEADVAPSFGTETIADQTYILNTAIATLNLPEATGGNRTLTYSLTQAAPAGLAYDANARTLTGTPTAVQSETAYTYMATDADGDTESLTFNITIAQIPTQARTLTYTFSDNGSTVTIAASGSLDTSGFNFERNDVPSDTSSIRMDDTDIWGIHPHNSIPIRRYNALPDFVITGEGSYGGNNEVTNLVNYISNYHVRFSTFYKLLQLDNANFTGDIYQITNGAATFNGTLQSTLGDNDFDIEFAIGNQKIVFQSANPATVPVAPTGLTATAGSTQVDLAWTNPNDSNITRYQVRYGAGSTVPTTATWEDISGSGAGTTTHTVTGLTNGTQYAFEIRAVNARGNSNASVTVTTTPEADTTPSFGTETIADQNYTRNTTIATLTLPEATGGNGTLTYSLTPNAPAGLVFDANARTLTGTPSAVQDATQYTYTVTDGDGDTASLTFNITVAKAVEPPHSPSNLFAIAGDTKVTLVWTNPNDPTITGYEVLYQYGSDPWEPIEGSDATTTRHTVEELVNGTEYTFQIRAVAGSVPGDPSIAIKATPQVAVPDAPENLTATAGDRSVSLSWDLPTNASVLDKVQVRRQARGETTWDPWTDLAADATTHTVTNLKNGQDYIFEVRAESASGAGPAARTAGRPELAVPGAPTQFSATAGDTEVALSWKLPTNTSEIVTVQVRWKATADLPFDDARDKWTDLPSSAATGYTATGLTNGTGYSFEVRATNSAGSGEPATGAATPRAPPLVAPGAPTNLSTVPGDTEVVVLWALPTNTSRIDSVELRHKVKTAPDTGWSGWSSLAGTAERSRVTGLVNGTDYLFEVRAKNAAGTGPSASVEGTPELSKPSAPSNLQASAGDTAVTLTWDLPDKGTVDTIDVRHKKKTDTSWSQWTLLAADATTRTVTGLDNGVSYEFEVRASNAAGSSDSVAVDAQPKLAIPEAPGNLTAAPGDGKVGLTWDLPTNTSEIDRMQVAYKLKSAANFQPWVDLAKDVTSHEVTGLTNGTEYTFIVRALNGAGRGAVAEVDATPVAVPTAPTGLAAAPGNTQVVLSWTLPTDSGVLTKVQAHHKADTAKQWQAWVDLAADATTHTVTGLTNGELYNFEVRAENASGAGAAASVSATPVPPLVAPGAPTNLSAVPGDTEVVVLWTLPTNTRQIDSVELRHKVKTDPDTGWSQWTSLAGTAERSRVTGLVNGTDYLFEVRAVNTAGTGPSASVEGTPNLAKPSSPSNLQASAGDTTVTLTWDLPDKGAVDTIDVRHKKKTDTSWGQWTLLAKDATTSTVTGLDNGVTYEFEVRATNAAGSSDSVAVDAQPKLAVPDAPTSLTATAGNAQVELSWTLPTNASVIGAVQVRWKATADLPFTASDAWTDLAGTATAYTATGLTNDTGYTFAVRATNTAGNGPAATATATPVVVPALDVSETNLWVPGGGSDTFTVKLTTAPSGPVTVAVVSNESDVTVSPASLKFSTTDYATAQTVTVNMAEYRRPFGGNGSVAMSASGGGYDGIAASVQVASVPVLKSIERNKPTESITNADRVRWKVSFSERVHFNDAFKSSSYATSFSPELTNPPAPVVSAGALLPGCNGSRTYDVDIGDFNASTSLDDYNGTVTLTLKPGVRIRSCTGVSIGDRTPTGPVESFTLDNIAPTVAITGVSGTVTAAVDATFTFSEPVTGFEAGDITLTNADASDFAQSGSGDGSTYTAKITPKAAGEFSVGVAANVAKDTAGNANTAATTVTATYQVPNNPPVVDKTIPDQELNEGKSGTVDLSAVFSDPDNDPLTFSAESSDTTQVTVAVNGSELTFTSVSAGKPTVTVTADDGRGGTVSTTFTVTVHALLNDPPEVVKPIEDLTLLVGETRDVDVSRVFNDPDKDPLTYTASSDDTSKATVTVKESTVTVAGVAAGASTVTVTADDKKSGTADNEFTVTVEADTTPSFGTETIADQNYIRNTAIATLTLPEATGGNGTLTYSLSSALPKGLAFDADARTLSGTPTEIQSATAYTYTVTDADGDTESLKFTISVAEAVEPPASPSNLIAIAGDTRVTLVWTDPNDPTITGYQVLYQFGSDPWEPIEGSDATTTRHTVENLVNGTEYTFQIRAVAGSLLGDPSIAVKATPQVAVPDAPDNLTATAGDRSVSLSWDLPTNASVLDKVQVRHQARGETTWEPWTDLVADATTHTVTNLKNGQDYLFEVRAQSGSGTGPAARTAGTPKLAVPGAPTRLSATAGDTEVDLGWTLPTNTSEIDTVQVRWKATVDLPFDDARDKWTDLPSSDASNHKVTGLTNGTGYTFEVRATNSAGSGEPATGAATPRAPPLVAPGPPTNLSTVPGDTEVVVLWTPPTNTSRIDSVELRHKVKTAPDTGWSEWSSLAGTAERSRVTGLVNGTDYLFEVRAVNAAGTGPSASVEGTPELAKPSAPSNLQASAGDTQVTLTWDLPDKGTVDTIDVRHKKKTDKSWSVWTLLAKDATTTPRPASTTA